MLLWKTVLKETMNVSLLSFSSSVFFRNCKLKQFLRIWVQARSLFTLNMQFRIIQKILIIFWVRPKHAKNSIYLEHRYEHVVSAPSTAHPSTFVVSLIIIMKFQNCCITFMVAQLIAISAGAGSPVSSVSEQKAKTKYTMPADRMLITHNLSIQFIMIWNSPRQPPHRRQ